MTLILSRTSDPDETRDWLDSLQAVIDVHGAERAHFLIDRLIDLGRRRGTHLPYQATTAYVNTILPGQEPRYPGDRSLERRIEAYLRWNAMAMVVHANKKDTHLGGHIATYQSAAVLYEVGFNHFWRAASSEHPGDLIFFQGHSAPGIYARSFLEGRLSKKKLLNFREEVGGQGLSSYPHPWLMPDYWQFPTVSMGLGPLMAIYLARFLRYMENRKLSKVSDRKVWAFLGDGEMDEPESMAAISLGAREAPWGRERDWTTWSSSSTATCSDSTVPYAATARSCRSSRPTSVAMAGMSSRSCGAPAGIRSWPRTATACWSSS